MANSITKTVAINARGKTLYQYHVTIDTNGADFTIHTPVSGNHVFVHGLHQVDSTGGTPTFKSGSDTIWAPELAANQGIGYKPERDSFIIATAKSEALKVNCSAAVTSMVVTVSEGDEF